MGETFGDLPPGARGRVLAVGEQDHRLASAPAAELLERTHDRVVERSAALRLHRVQVADDLLDVVGPCHLDPGVPREADEDRLISGLEELVDETADRSPHLGEVLDHRARGIDCDRERQGQVLRRSEALDLDADTVLVDLEVGLGEPRHRNPPGIQHDDRQLDELDAHGADETAPAPERHDRIAADSLGVDGLRGQDRGLLELRDRNVDDAGAGGPARDELRVEVEVDFLDLRTAADRNGDPALAADDRRLGSEQHLDADLTGRVVEHDGVLAEIAAVGVEGHRPHLGALDDRAERNRNRPRRAVAAAELAVVVEELD